MSKIQFTSEHEKQLKDLYLELGFSGSKLDGKFGANSYSADQLLHQVSIETLKGFKSTLKKEIDELEKEDEWTSSVSSKKLTSSKKWYDYVNLLIGYKLSIAENEATQRLIRKEAQAKLGLLSKAKDAAEIDRISKLSQEDLDKEIAAIQATLV
jgi:hypothetical protein